MIDVTTGLLRRVLPLGLALLLAACGTEELHRNLDEAQANDVVAALSEVGIDAHKAPLDEEKWAVSVAPGNFSRAVETLRSRGLPREHHATLGEVFAKEGFTSTPLEERARLIHGLQQELAGTISAIDGVAQARVHITLPEPDPLSRETRPSSAAVFVKYRAGFAVEKQTAAVKALVTNAIEGLSYDKVSVVMVPGAEIETAPAGGWSVPALLRPLLLGAALLLLGVAGFGWWRRRRAAKLPVPAE